MVHKSNSYNHIDHKKDYDIAPLAKIIRYPELVASAGMGIETPFRKLQAERGRTLRGAL